MKNSRIHILFSAFIVAAFITSACGSNNEPEKKPIPTQTPATSNATNSQDVNTGSELAKENTDTRNSAKKQYHKP